MTRDKMKLCDIRTLIVDNDRFGVTLLVQMLHGLGLDTIKIVDTGAAAQAQLGNADFELCICDGDLSDMTAAEFLRWLRRRTTPARFTPVMVMTAYSDFRSVTSFRDAGAHIVVKKPPSPQVLYDRIAWLAQPGRPFVEAEGYVGPDRRFKSIGPPEGIGRRATDLSAEVGQATEPNLSQDEIDCMVKPMKVFAE